MIIKLSISVFIFFSDLTNTFKTMLFKMMIRYIFVLFLFQLNAANVSQLSMIFTSNLNVLDWEY